MTEVQDKADRAACLRRAGLVLTLIWAGVWTLNGLLMIWVESGGDEWIARFSLGNWVAVAVLLVIPWVSVAVAWRWAAIGGVALVLAALLSAPPVWWGDVVGGSSIRSPARSWESAHLHRQFLVVFCHTSTGCGGRVSAPRKLAEIKNLGNISRKCMRAFSRVRKRCFECVGGEARVQGVVGAEE